MSNYTEKMVATLRDSQPLNLAKAKDLAADFAQYWSEHANESLRARDWLLRCLCPGLADLYIVKLALALCLIGGVGNIDRTGMRTRGEAHMLLVGDAGTGKSQVLRYAAKLSSRAVLTTGMGSTSAGLTCTAVRDPGGEWMLEAGALVLADVMLGKADASHIRSPSTPCTRSLLSTTDDAASGPIRQVPHRWKTVPPRCRKSASTASSSILSSGVTGSSARMPVSAGVAISRSMRRAIASASSRSSS